MWDHVVRTIEDRGGGRRVVIYRRADGLYGFTEERWSDEPYEQCWFPYDSGALCDSEETALREAYGRFAWLAEQHPAS
jgi:hypothetical protein